MTWSPELNTPGAICLKMLADLEVLGRKLPEYRYYRVRYEDIVASPYSSMQQIYGFMGESWSSEVEKAIKQHTEMSINNATWGDRQKWKQYSTYRNYSNYRELWRSEMDMEEVKEVERDCMEVMGRLHYDPLYILS